MSHRGLLGQDSGRRPPRETKFSAEDLLPPASQSLPPSAMDQGPEPVFPHHATPPGSLSVAEIPPQAVPLEETPTRKTPVARRGKRAWSQGSATLTRAAPPWLVSLVLHMLVLIVLALLYFPVVITEQLEIQLAPCTQEQGMLSLDGFSTLPTLDETAMLGDEFSLAGESQSDASASPVWDVRLQTFAAAGNLPAADIGRALSGRRLGAKRNLLSAYGGTAATENAVRLGLQWLQRNQRRSGAWSLTGPYANGAPLENEPAATAMAMLALLGGGHTHRDGEFKDSMARAAQALLRMQDGDGNFYHATVDNHRLYSQALATIAVCELYGMTQDEQFRGAAQRALDYAAAIQADDGDGGGGWRYVPGQDIDTSVTGWFVMALESGKMAGLESSPSALQRVSVYLDHVTDDGVHYRYRAFQPPSVSMTAEALLCRQYLGWNRDDPRLQDGARYLGANPIQWTEKGRKVYYWYYATQVLHHLGGQHWDRWNEALRRVLPSHQLDSGRERGSWNPLGDDHGEPGGRLFTTCLSIFMLEVYYRHLPIYART